VDVDVPWGESDRARNAVDRATASLGSDPAWADALLDPPRVMGIERFSGGAVTLRAVARVDPYRRDDVARDLRQRIKAALDEEGVAAFVPLAPPIA
jgi:moderate conductance mechanosensitive channel